METLTPQQLQKEFTIPLAALVSEMTTEIAAIEAEIAAGTFPLGYLPVSPGMARRGLAQLGKFIRSVKARHKDILEGAYRYRKDELALMREKYRKQTKKK